MSQLNIKGLVDNIKTRTSVYTPLVEAIVNSIQAIEDIKRKEGIITIMVERGHQDALNLEDEALPEIQNVSITDNGIGFTKQNRDSFDTLHGDLKAEKGGKGFGRFMFLKYFDSVSVESNFFEDGKYYSRSFDFGKDREIIENELLEVSDSETIQTTISLKNIKNQKLEKKIDTIARKLLEKLLIYFINDDYTCPIILIKELGKSHELVLNNYLSNREHAEIQEMHTQDFELRKNSRIEKFKVKVFKIYYPNNQKSKISLTAHNREVTETVLHKYVPEFEDDFYDEFNDEKGVKTRKDYIIKAYVLGKYLDDNVSTEREDFKFSASSDLFFSFGQEEIEEKVAEIVRKIFPDEVKTRQNKKLDRITEYVSEKAPWDKVYLKDLNLSSVPFKLDDESIASELHKVKFKKEANARVQIEKILNDPTIEITDSIEKVLGQISEAEMSELAHYIALRRIVLNLFRKSLEIREDGKYNIEDTVHSIIFPTKSDSNQTPYLNHNLWMLDEKLNFTDYISSDKPLNGRNTERGDIIVFNKKMAFRGGEEASNPITIFEFKRPQRDDFVNGSSDEDPVEQIIRYVNDIRDGKFKTPKGREISVSQNTPFYGFVICDFTEKVTTWLRRVKDFKPMPDGRGWFQWYSNNNLYIEVLSYDKVLNDAEMRNKIFFKKLGIE